MTFNQSMENHELHSALAHKDAERGETSFLNPMAASGYTRAWAGEASAFAFHLRVEREVRERSAANLRRYVAR